MHTTEVADSDDELELASAMNDDPPVQGTFSASTSATDPLNVKFDQFLSPTQRLSSLNSPSHEGRHEQSISAIDPPPTTFDGSADNTRTNTPGHQDFATMPTKRSRSALEGSNTVEVVHEDNSGRKKKRAKTYGQQRSRPQSSQDPDLFAKNTTMTGFDLSAYSPTQELGSMPVSANDVGTLEVNLSEDVPATHEWDTPVHNDEARERNRPRRVVSLLGDSMSEQSQLVTTSRSSMGSYESINLDYRKGQALDLHANPFVSFSPADAMTSQQKADKVMDIFRQAQGSRRFEPQHAEQATDDFIAECVTSPEISRESEQIHPGSEPHLPDTTTEADAALREPVLGATATDEQAALATDSVTHSRNHVTTTNDESQPLRKKRGRKPKSTKVMPEPGHVLEDNDDELHHDVTHVETEEAAGTRSRSGTLDSLAYTQTGNRTSNTARKRKQLVPAETESSPVKLPTSELHLSDEAMIGLPKEKYQPRSSRSRSKQVIDEVHEISLDVPPKHEEFTKIEAQVDTATPAKSAKKGRKSKVKRAKTTAAALLKKTEPMLSEGEEDVMWLDTKPAKVKLNLPPEVSPQKVKGEDLNADKDKDEPPEDEKMNNKSKPGISIEIPAPKTANHIEESQPAPKKRGRKKKIVPEIEAPAEPEPEPPRIPLAEKSINTTYVPLPTTKDDALNSKPAVSPLTPPKAALPSASPPQPQQLHSPLKTLSATKPGSKYRLGLSKRHSIPSLLRRVDKEKKAPTVVVRKEKEKKNKKGEDNGSDDEAAGGRAGPYGMRDERGMLVEWDF